MNLISIYVAMAFSQVCIDAPAPIIRERIYFNGCQNEKYYVEANFLGDKIYVPVINGIMPCTQMLYYPDGSITRVYTYDINDTYKGGIITYTEEETRPRTKPKPQPKKPKRQEYEQEEPPEQKIKQRNDDLSKIEKAIQQNNELLKQSFQRLEKLERAIYDLEENSKKESPLIYEEEKPDYNNGLPSILPDSNSAPSFNPNRRPSDFGKK